MAGGATACGDAFAHSTMPGIGNFYNGALHPLTTASQLVALAAFGLLLGQRGLATHWPALAALFVALVLGLGIGAWWVGEVGVATPLLLLAIATALAVVVEAKVTPAVLATAAGPLGLALGLGSAPEGQVGTPVAVSLLGTLTGAVLCAAFVAQLVEAAAGRPALRIGVRVIGSWLAATALLVLALSLPSLRAAAPPPAVQPARTVIGASEQREGGYCSITSAPAGDTKRNASASSVTFASKRLNRSNER